MEEKPASAPVPLAKDRSYNTDDAALELFHYDAAMDGTIQDFEAEVKKYYATAISLFANRHHDILFKTHKLEQLRLLEREIRSTKQPSRILDAAKQLFSIMDTFVKTNRDAQDAGQGGVHAHGKVVRRDKQGPDPKLVQKDVVMLMKRFAGLKTESQFDEAIKKLQHETESANWRPHQLEARNLVIEQLESMRLTAQEEPQQAQ